MKLGTKALAEYWLPTMNGNILGSVMAHKIVHSQGLKALQGAPVYTVERFQRAWCKIGCASIPGHWFVTFFWKLEPTVTCAVRLCSKIFCLALKLPIIILPVVVLCT
jgi:hypothetical protein